MTNQIDAAALAEFTEYFVWNYPGPDTIISDPRWHAPRIFRAVLATLTKEAAQAEAAGEDMAAFGASEAACYQYPGDGQSGERAAFCAGAAHAAARFTPYRSLGECDTAAIRAAQFLEEAEDHHANCPDCEGEGVPEQCETCFPLFDKARVERRLVMQSLAALAPPPTQDVGALVEALTALKTCVSPTWHAVLDRAIASLTPVNGGEDHVR